MKDPRNSETLSEGGARLKDGGGSSKASRRRHRRAKGPAKTVTAEAERPASTVAAADAPPPVRKKKRRRGKRRGGNAEAHQASAHPQPATTAEQATSGTTDESTRQGETRPASRRRKRRRGRSSFASGPLDRDGFRHAQAPEADKAGATPPSPSPQPGNGTARQVAGEPQELRAPQYGRSSRSSNGELYAALDLGTNNCRLLIAQPTRHQQFRVVDGFSRIVRLGEGLAATGSLSPEAMDRAVEALAICATKLKGRDVKRMRLIATEACRAADNGDAFLDRVLDETGLQLEVINRETEARLAVSSCASLIGKETRAAVLFDIGGGSSEIAVIRLGEHRSQRLANHISHWTSLPVGVVTLSERYGGHDVTPSVFEAMVSEVEALLGDFHCPAIDHSHIENSFHLIGTSGTVTTLAGVHLGLARYDRRKVDGIWLSEDEVTAMQNKLLSWDFAGRAANPCIGPDRADLVLAGCAILEAIRRRWPAPRMRVADRGLREGILTDLMMRDGAWRRSKRRSNSETSFSRQGKE
ncbi:exopolyphosphatase [Martelella alba]|uniref:Exopolyphosphatase n=1 Tax=Martelella alba TaxID=2590451 RepID=A0A506UFJ0_9HYPH|nr:Ppx/GppA phosphatase family protein [Martelella alba]TPW30597.1 exopolyphosphatase [Martelella alba]